jgi:bifunctional non-homologous end joining protein LigD
MALKEYRRKRTFGKTPEPGPSRPRAGEGRHFVVQKHQASHLHYDLRLEHAGALKSWAVPKGPSMDPHDKRLAIMVEDHPIEYQHFAGRIPEGEYGAGLVEIWDKGTYTVDAGPGEDPAKVMAAGLLKGHIDFRLDGKKLRGLFTLVRLKPRGDGKNNQWLLMKRSEPAPEATPKPAGRGRGAKADPPPRARSLEERDLAGAVKKPFPSDASPMLATLVDGPFDREGWAFEVKWDGYRSLAVIKGGKVRLLSRNGKALNAKFPTVAAALSGFPVDTVFDGEIVAVDAKGRPHFQDLQNSMSPGNGRILYYVFDVLYAGGYELRALPLRRRRAILEKLLPASETVRLSEAIERTGRAFFRAAETNGLEGIIAKDLASPYRSGSRTREWLKIKVHQRQEAVVCGFTRPRASRKYFGALILGAFRKGKLVYIGHVGTGFTERSLKDIRAKLTPLATPRSPFAEEPRTNMPVSWVAPRLICEVKFSEWTDEGLMRHPVFLGLREDKSTYEVEPEEAEPREALFQRTKFRTRAELTHLDKVFWPGEGYTKGDLVEYYRRMAEWILPYLKDRPQALNRHPDGITGESFFQKNLVQAPPSWVKTVNLASESKNKDIRYLVCQNRDSLLYEVNLGCIELNVWSSSVPHVDSPDYIVLDFDPLETSFPSVVEAVLAAKEFLDEIAIPAFCKTSGATGLHVYIPLAPGFSYEQARELAHLVCLVVNRRNPDLTSLERTPAKRGGRIYLDYLQNREGATMAAPYAVRPRDGAPVSTPLEWKEVTAKLDPLDFNIRTVPERMARKGDAWRDLFKKRLDLNAAMAGFERWQKNRKTS